VQVVESREWRKPRSQYKETKVAPTKPKVDSLIATMRKHWQQDKASKGRHQTRKPKAINKSKGKKKMETKNTPAKASPTSAPRRKQRGCLVWREYRLSLPLQDRTNPRSIEQIEESRSRNLNYEPSSWGKLLFISYFPSNILFRASSIFKFQIWFHHCISK
jgi:hypothetical protein